MSPRETETLKRAFIAENLFLQRVGVSVKLSSVSVSVASLMSLSSLYEKAHSTPLPILCRVVGPQVQIRHARGRLAWGFLFSLASLSQTWLSSPLATQFWLFGRQAPLLTRGDRDPVARRAAIIVLPLPQHAEIDEYQIRFLKRFVNEGGSLLILCHYSPFHHESNINDLTRAFDVSCYGIVRRIDTEK